MSVRRTRLFLAAVSAVLLVAVSGCGASDKAESPASTADRGVAAPGVAQEGGAGPAKEPNKVPDNLDVENRSIIYAGTMTVRVDDVDAAAARAISFATQAGGFVGGDNRRRDDRRSTGTLVLRIPAAKFTPTLEQLKDLGDEEDRTITAQDVTDQVVDVQARLDNAAASVDRIRALLAKATTIGEITSLESELSRRLSDLESLQARKRKLDGLTALSTITLQLLGPEAAIAKDKDEIGIAAGFKNGLAAFLASLQVALTVLGWLTPWILLLGVPLYVLIRLIRRYRPKRPALVPAGAPAAGPVPGWNPPPFPATPRPGHGPRSGPLLAPVPPARGPVSGPPAATGPGAAGPGAAGPGAAGPGAAGPGTAPPAPASPTTAPAATGGSASGGAGTDPVSTPPVSAPPEWTSPSPVAEGPSPKAGDGDRDGDGNGDGDGDGDGKPGGSPLRDEDDPKPR
ncbi:DUF4349 domain-containing protein [Dactylosporangium siamense]|uniref:DUF4349 domain-containing protein n=1 Tax=Dactylosporangium siamense TaxID=685454 RepID=A0A919PQ62_9ACTN|nr:DUF4349 domain-containing protein [Dactylosporangium siamense]GIG46328.1 hypothetical protein Dsi01nite_043690 [Dactylosporangium siamense]